MACFHPLKAFQIGLTPNLKADFKVCSYDADHVEYIPRLNKWEVSSVPLRSERASKVVREFITIPCGQCIGCRLDHSRQWANRLMMERQYHENAFFITLTYNDLHLPISHRLDDSTGELLDVATLRKKDLQDFIKRLRFSFPDCSIRYYACGEYGDQKMRPHYHVIVFGLNLVDLQFHHARDGFAFYRSPAIERVWSRYDNVNKIHVPIGHVLLTDVSWNTCAYVARYVMKKRKGKDACWYDLHCLDPEFVCMSLKPGIASQYYADHPEIYDFDEVVLGSGDKVIKSKPPRYFDKLFDIDYPDEMAAIKNSRLLLAQNAQAIQLSKTSLNYIELLATMEENKQKSIKKLIRPLEDY